jgi:catechol 2,3-dioxygenase
LGILRLSHLELRVPDLELGAAYYTEVLGLVQIDRELGDGDERVYLKCWDEHDHHSLVLRGQTSAGAGLDHLSFKVECANDIDVLEGAAEQAGCATRRLAPGAEAGQGEALRIQAPTGHELEVVHSLARVGSLLPRVNPPPEPAGLLGVHPPRLDHVHVTAEEVGPATTFFAQVLGFRVTEKLVGRSGALLGTWLERSHTPCDLAITRGPNGGLHHFGFWLDDWDQIRRAADVLASQAVAIESGPTRHGITRSLALNFFDPFGNRNQVLTGGYRRDPGDEPTIWTEEEIGRAFFPYRAQLDQRALLGAGTL